METVRILDNYRMAVARDAKAIRILSLLQRDGAQTETDLAAGTPQHDIRAKLTELFRANLIQLFENRLYTLTDIAEQVLTSLGVADAVATAAIDSSTLEEMDKQFLVTFFEGREHQPAALRRYLSAAAKSAKQLVSYARLDDEVKARLWYGVVAGFEPTTHELGPDIAAGRALDHADLQVGNRVFQLKYFTNRCEFAARDRVRSNEFIATGRQLPSEPDGEVTLALTLTRLIAASLSQYADEGLSAAAGVAGVHTDARRALHRWISNFEHDYVPAVNKHLWTIKPSTTDLIDSICSDWASARWSAAPVAILDDRTVRSSPIILALRFAEERLRSEHLSEVDKLEAFAVVTRIQKSLTHAAEEPKVDPPSS